MSEVKLKIGKNLYAVACPAGQEAHIAKLGQMIAEKYEALGNSRAPQEAQNLLFSALFLADELHELRSAPGSASPASSAPPAREPEDAAGSKGGKKAELRAEIDELKKDQKKLTKQRDDLVKQLADLESSGNSAQTDMFGEDAIAAKLENLAEQVEACARAFEDQA